MQKRDLNKISEDMTQITVAQRLLTERQEINKERWFRTINTEKKNITQKHPQNIFPQNLRNESKTNKARNVHAKDVKSNTWKSK